MFFDLTNMRTIFNVYSSTHDFSSHSGIKLDDLSEILEKANKKED